MNKKQEIEILIKTLSSNPYIIEFFDNVLSNSTLLENLFKIEQSAKITKDKILSDRFVLQFTKTSDIKLDTILNFYERYKFPLDRIPIAKEYFNRIDCNTIILGIEADNNKIRYKLYFEYSNYNKILGIKWGDNKSELTYYNKIFKIPENTPKFILDRNHNIIGIYDITNENNKRNAFDFMFDSKTTYLKDISKDILSITNQNINCLTHLKWFDLRHFTEGIDNKYFNIYFVVYWKI